MLDRQAAMDALVDRATLSPHRGRLDVPPAHSATLTNPRCGDVVTVFAEVADGCLRRVAFDGAGCTVSQAAADLVAEMAERRSPAEVGSLGLDEVLARLGPDVVRTRRDCASLGLRALQHALAAPA